MPPPQGSEACDTTEGGGPQDSATGVAHDGGVLAPESDIVVDVNEIGGALIRTKMAVGVSSS
jgi:hypothetical protein